jgi:hypothetical protein
MAEPPVPSFLFPGRDDPVDSDFAVLPRDLAAPYLRGIADAFDACLPAVPPAVQRGAKRAVDADADGAAAGRRGRLGREGPDDEGGQSAGEEPLRGSSWAEDLLNGIFEAVDRRGGAEAARSRGRPQPELPAADGSLSLPWARSGGFVRGPNPTARERPPAPTAVATRGTGSRSTEGVGPPAAGLPTQASSRGRPWPREAPPHHAGRRRRRRRLQGGSSPLQRVGSSNGSGKPLGKPLEKPGGKQAAGSPAQLIGRGTAGTCFQRWPTAECRAEQVGGTM